MKLLPLMPGSAIDYGLLSNSDVRRRYVRGLNRFVCERARLRINASLERDLRFPSRWSFKQP